MRDPRSENCKEFKVNDRGKVVGVELDYIPKPETEWELYNVELIDEEQAQGRTIAYCTAMDENKVPVYAPIALVWTYYGDGKADFDNFGLPGSGGLMIEHPITNTYNPKTRRVGPLAIAIIDVAESKRLQKPVIVSDVIAGLGLPAGRHVSFTIVFRKRPKAPEPTPEPEPEPTPDYPDLETALQELAQKHQAIQFNPDAALQKHIFADGFVPNSPEFEVQFGGKTYIAQRAEHLKTGEVRVYYAEKGKWDQVNQIRSKYGR